jgi:hypothetical protein
MTIPADRAAVGRPPSGKEESTTRRPVLPRLRSLLTHRRTANIPTFVLTGVSASTRNHW